MTRVAVALAVVVALASGVWLLWPDDEQPLLPSTTLPAATPTSTVGRSTTTTASLTTTTTEDLVDTVEEAEAILRELWFGWFDGIYHQDEDRIREMVATEEQVGAAKDQFGRMAFIAQPLPEGIVFTEIEILRSDSSCLAIWSTSNASSFLATDLDRTGVDVFRWTGTRWHLFGSWRYRADLWESDCESSL